MSSNGQNTLDRIVGHLTQRIRIRRDRARLALPTLFLALALLLLPAGSALLSPAASSGTIPTFKIVSVVEDSSVTIRTYNFPANQVFTATMGPMGTRGVGGYVVGTINSGAGGTFDATFSVPAALKGSYQISVRLQTAHAFPYYAYNWFYNNTTGGTGGIPGYAGIPTFKIKAVEKDKSVTIVTNNYPAGQTFTVTMGPFGTRGIGGIVVGTLNSGAGGTLTATYNIPDALKGHYRIAIRAQTAHLYPYFSYNWFYNNTATVPDAGTGGQPEPAPSPAPPSPGYTGIPVMSITSVKANESVTFQTYNYPANQTFYVTMGVMGSRGIGGILVSQFDSGTGGSFPVTVSIPPALAGSYQIAIRAQTAHAYPYFSYNWFYNNTTP